MTNVQRVAKDTMTTLALLALVAGLPLCARIAQDLVVHLAVSAASSSAPQAKVAEGSAPALLATRD